MKFLILSFILCLQSFGFADIKNDFANLMSKRKGPFSLNYLQGTEARVEVTNNVSAPKGFLFQAAFRNEDARSFVNNYGVYLANLFSTNYYELMGEYVYNDAYGSHGLDHKALLNSKTFSFPKAVKMTCHWILEKYFLEKNSHSKLAQTFQLRGISDAANEQTFAHYFFNYYISAMNEDSQYLTAFLLAQKSPIADMNSLDKVRNLVSESYDYFVTKFGANDSRVKPLYQIRNAVHNQMSPGVIQMIDDYDKNFPFYRSEGNTYLFEVRKILVDYYNINASKIGDLASKLNLKDIKGSAKELVQGGAQLNGLLVLSNLGAELKSNLQMDSLLTYSQKTDGLVLVGKIAQYLGKEISVLKKVEDKAVYQILLNIVYMEGFLIKDNWSYFKDEILNAADLKSAQSIMNDILSIGMDTLDISINESLLPWIQIEPKMQNFRDDTIKSSSLNLISLLEKKLN